MNKLIIYVLLFLGGLGVGYFWGQNSHSESFGNIEPQNTVIENANQTTKETRDELKTQGKTETEIGFSNDQTGIPSKVLKVLSQIEETGEAPEGYVGGRKFKNLEGLLPKKNADDRKINYQEWDVNPKVDGKNRGKERLVTGDDRSAYFTNDHYQSFKKIK